MSYDAKHLRQLQPLELIDLLDEWTQRQDMLARQVAVLRQAFSQQPEASLELLSLLLEAKQSRPSSAWLRRSSKAHKALPHPVMSELLLTLAGVYTQEASNQEHLDAIRGIYTLETNNQEYLDTLTEEASNRNRAARNVTRGAIWALANFPEAKVYDFLTQTVLTWAGSGEGHPACGTAAVWTLHRLGNEAALRELNDLRSRVSHRALLSKIQDALVDLASQSGLTLDELSDQLVPDHGLSVQGERTWLIGDFRISLRISSDGQLEQMICDPQGKQHRSLPKQVREANLETWQAVLAEKRAIAKTLTSQQKRLEVAMIDGRRWSSSAWGKTFAHPLLSRLACRLIWEMFGADGTRIGYVLPQADQTWQDALGKAVQVPADGSLAIAHPVEMSPEQQSAWQHYVVSQHLVQPFKQVLRETYVPTPAELDHDYSDRFVGRQVLSRHLYALTRTRNWSGTLGLTGFDGSGVGYRDFPTRNVRAHLCHRYARHDHEPVTLEHVSFQALELKGYNHIPLTSVHAVAFSETMRDIDLVIAKASTA